MKKYWVLIKKALPAVCQETWKRYGIMVFCERELILSTIFLIKCYWNDLTVSCTLKLVLCFIFK